MIELNRLYNEDCLKTMSKMDDEFIDLTVTSPPYDNLRNYKGYEFNWREIIKELYRVIKKGGIVVWVVSDATINGSETGTSFRQSLWAIECGFNLHDTMIYAKNNPIPQNHNRYEQLFEYMFVWSKGSPKLFNPIKTKTKNSGKKYSWKCRNDWGETSAKRSRDEISVIKDKKNISNIWFMNTANGVFTNSAPFPEQLVENHIVTWTNENDVIYDPMAGSGTVPKMAVLNNRNWIASEISKDYCEIIFKRMKEPQKQRYLMDL